MTDATDVIVTITHLRGVPGFSPRPGFCAGKSREWFARHGLDWSAFVSAGIAASELEATGDAMALALVAYARETEATTPDEVPDGQ